MALFAGYDIAGKAERDFLNRLTALQNMRIVCRLNNDSVIIRTKRGDYWFITDNGGELNVEKVNHPETMRSIPYIADKPIDTMTLAVWIGQFIRGEPIDWSWRAGEGERFYRYF